MTRRLGVQNATCHLSMDRGNAARQMQILTSLTDLLREGSALIWECDQFRVGIVCSMHNDPLEY